MSSEPINYEAVIADLEAKKAHLETTIAGLRAVAGLGNLGAPTPGGPGGILPSDDAWPSRKTPCPRTE
jgi:hypothetical protein